MREPMEHDGLMFTRTELGDVSVGKDACPEAIAVADLDGDGRADLLAIESPGYEEVRELCALHGPSGKVVWRALRGQAGKRLALSDGVVVLEGADGTSLHGVEARTGRQLWSTELPAELSDDPYDLGMTWNAPALADHGAHVSFGCEDGSAHVVESKTGRLVVSRRGRLLEPNHGIPGIVAFLDGGMTHRILELWDLARNCSILRARVQHRSPMAVSPDGGLYVFYADVLPSDVPMTRVVCFHAQTKERRSETWVTPSDRHNLVPHNGLPSDPHRLAALGGERLLLAGDDEERGGGILIDLRAPATSKHPKPPSVKPVSRMPPPRPGFVLRCVERFAETVVTVWEHPEEHRLLALGFDSASLEPRWFVGDAGGVALKNHCLRTETALLLPFASAGKEEHAPGAPVYWGHLDPATGARLCPYAVKELDCVRMHGRYLVGHSTTFPGAPPVVWDTERRERVL